MKVVVATRNAGKLDELRNLLPTGLELLTLDDVNIESPEETGETFEENALIKARHAARSGYLSLADDSGLVVDALDGAPGVHSSRFAGEDANDAVNNKKLIAELDRAGVGDRAARFVSVVAAVSPDGRELTATGSVEGRIVDAPRGSGGFGYDPHFELHDPNANDLNGRTMAELTLEQKNSVSHRSRAYQALLARIASSDGERQAAFRALVVSEHGGRAS